MDIEICRYVFDFEYKYVIYILEGRRFKRLLHASYDLVCIVNKKVHQKLQKLETNSFKGRGGAAAADEPA